MASRSSTTEPPDPASRSTRTPRSLPETVTVGRVRRPHGIRGGVLVEVLTDVAGRLAAGSELLLVPAAGATRPVTVTAHSPHKHGALMQFAGVDDRDAAASLRGATLEVERSRVPPAPPETYYHFQLVGLVVRDLEAGELGEVVNVVEDGGGVLLVVSDGRRTLPVPFVQSFIRRLDVELGELELELPPGLIELCASKS